MAQKNLKYYEVISFVSGHPLSRSGDIIQAFPEHSARSVRDLIYKGLRRGDIESIKTNGGQCLYSAITKNIVANKIVKKTNSIACIDIYPTLIDRANSLEQKNSITEQLWRGWRR